VAPRGATWRFFSRIGATREGTLTPDQCVTCLDRVEADTTLFVLRDLTLDLCTSNILPAIATPRSLDPGHLRTALWFHATEGITRFVTLDAAQEAAAKELAAGVNRRNGRGARQSRHRPRHFRECLKRLRW
jgi:hypothetical protein